MDINDKDAGAYFKLLSGGGARGVAAGTGDNTEAVGEIVDMQAQPGPMSGFIFVAGSAVLADTKSISINDVGIEHGDAANLSDKSDYDPGNGVTEVDFAAVKTSDGGTTELFAIKLNQDLSGVKRYWRVKVTPDLNAADTDTFQLGFGFAAICDDAPQS
jgi:hypothetical protein